LQLIDPPIIMYTMSMHNFHDWREQRRLRALELYSKGWQQKLIAEALDVTKGAISQWVKKFKDVPEDQRAEAVRIPKPTGRKPIIQPEDQAKLVTLIEQGAETLGFVGDVWTAARVQAIARRELGIDVGITTIKTFLHRAGYSVQKPEVKATQQSEEAVARFRADWTALKKGQLTRE
jgi:transposase